MGGHNQSSEKGITFIFHHPDTLEMTKKVLKPNRENSLPVLGGAADSEAGEHEEMFSAVPTLGGPGDAITETSVRQQQ